MLIPPSAARSAMYTDNVHIVSMPKNKVLLEIANDSDTPLENDTRKISSCEKDRKRDRGIDAGSITIPRSGTTD